MSFYERFIIAVLTAFDFMMDVLTFGAWTYEQGNVVPDVTVKE